MTEAERASNNSPKATEQMHPLQDPNDWVLVSLVLATPATCPGVLLPFLLLLSVFNPWTSHATSKSLPTPTLLPISSSIWPNPYFSKTSKTIMLLFGQLNCSGLLKKKSVQMNPWNSNPHCWRVKCTSNTWVNVFTSSVFLPPWPVGGGFVFYFLSSLSWCLIEYVQDAFCTS